MMENTPTTPVDMLAETQKLYRTTAEELIRAINALRAGDAADAKGMTQTIRDLRTALGWAIDERCNVEKIGKTLAASASHGTALDLDAARDEVGRRLSRLRAAADERGISKQP
ncbi:MAG: hypothetical protein ACK4SS_03725 [Cypionkella sp.]